MAPTISNLDHLVLTVASIPNTVAFYRDVLGMKAIEFSTLGGTRWALKYGNQKINLHPLGGFEPKAKHARAGTADLCFLSETPIVDWVAHLEQHMIEIQEGPVMRTGAVGAILSIYVRDPDGNLIEVSNLK